jgi:hypothetical protein
MRTIRFCGLFILIFLLQSCTVSLKNIGLDYSALKTFNTAQFVTKAPNAPPTSGQDFSERLKLKILNNTRLNYADDLGDVEFQGSIVNYAVSSLAPQANQTVAFQRLTITISVKFTNNAQDDKDWQQQFTRFADFSAEQDLSSVETVLIEDIYKQLLEDVFNKAFSGW